MSEINITLPDKSVKVLPKGVTPQEVANSIGSGLARAVVVSKIDGELKDLNYSLEEDCSLELFTGDSPEGHDTLLHSTAHLMAQAVKSLFPKSKVTIGPTIENGFYYDFDVDTPFTDEIILKIEKRVHGRVRKQMEPRLVTVEKFREKTSLRCLLVLWCSKLFYFDTTYFRFQ